MQPAASDERDILAYTEATPSSPPTRDGPDRRRGGRRFARTVVNGVVAGVALLGVLGPAVILLVALSWGVVTYVRTVALLVDIVHARDFAALGPQLHELNLAARLALLSAGYFALVFSLIVVYAGVLAGRRRRVALIPGLLLAIPSLAAYLLGAVLSSVSVNAETGIPIAAQAVFFLYVLFDAIALGALLADTRRPVRRVRRFMRRRRYFLWQRMPYYSRRLQSRYEVFREALHDGSFSSPQRPPDESPLAPIEEAGPDSAAPDDTSEPPSNGENDEGASGLTIVA
jgi:hypothetical protein